MNIKPVGERVLLKRISGNKCVIGGKEIEIVSKSKEYNKFFVEVISEAIKDPKIEVGDEVILYNNAYAQGIQGMKFYAIVAYTDIWGVVKKIKNKE